MKTETKTTKSKTEPKVSSKTRETSVNSLSTPGSPLLGKKIHGFSLLNSKGVEVSLPQKNHQFTVLFFYPKDDTPGCTIENKDFSNLAKEFEKLNVGVYGVSKDSVQSHDKFSCKYHLKNDLLADVEGKVCDLFDVIKEKNMYGRKYMGIERSTFILDSEFKIVHATHKVKVDGHAEDILQRVLKLHA